LNTVVRRTVVASRVVLALAVLRFRQFVLDFSVTVSTV